MKATKFIKNAIEGLGVTMQDCKLLFQARSWGEDKETTFDAAIIMIIANCKMYAIRARHNGINIAYIVNTGFKDAKLKIMLLDYT